MTVAFDFVGILFESHFHVFTTPNASLRGYGRHERCKFGAGNELLDIVIEAKMIIPNTFATTAAR